MGPNGIVQSICQDDFGPAIDELIDLAAAHVQPECLPEPLERRANGRLACDVIWELPKSAQGCDASPFLSEVSAPRSKINASGGANCKVRQLAVTADQVAAGDGFYYDDFSQERRQECRNADAARIMFSEAAKPAQNVRVVIDCDANEP